jgi:CHASE3 domain sensor protein
MWPKVLMQLFELLPHVSRLVPMAERYFSGRATVERNNESTLAAMADSVDGTMGQMAKAHESLYRRLQETDGRIADLSDEVRQMRSLAEQNRRQLQTIAGEVGSLGLWLKIVTALVAILIVLVVVLLMRGH